MECRWVKLTGVVTYGATSKVTSKMKQLFEAGSIKTSS